MIALYMLLGVLAALLAVTLIRAALCRPEKSVRESAPPQPVDEDGIPERMAGAIRIATLSTPDPADTDREQFYAFHRYLERQYPRIHAGLTRERVEDMSLLYRWRGSDPQLRPMALLSHMDVVPVAPETRDEWEREPFGGEFDGEFVWGRGALDMKSHLIAVMEAVEHLLAEGYQPRRDLYLCFGHNEEVVGDDASGALSMMRVLRDRGIRLECVLDEGGMAMPGDMLGVRRPVAMVGIAEKGYMDVELRLNHPGGHSSQPPASTGLGRMAAAIVRMEKHPFGARLTRPVEEMFRAVAPHTGFGMRLALANMGLLRPLLLRALSGKNMTNALVRTTASATMAQASPAANVLPQVTRFTVNCRILPGESVQGTLDTLRRICADPAITFTVLRSKEPSGVSPVDSPAFRTLSRTIGAFFGDSVVSPYLMVGGTDSASYEPVCENIYRFSPLYLDGADLGRIHGTNERVSRENLVRATRFFMAFIRSMNAE